MDETIPIAAIKSSQFSFERDTQPEHTEWTLDTKKIAGMYGIALGLGNGRLADIATNIFDSDTAKLFADAATKYQTDTEEYYGYASPVFITDPDGRPYYHSEGKTPGQR